MAIMHEKPDDLPQRIISAIDAFCYELSIADPTTRDAIFARLIQDQRYLDFLLTVGARP